MIDEVTNKIEAYVRSILYKEQISREEFDLLVNYRTIEEGRAAIRAGMEALHAVRDMPCIVHKDETEEK